MFRSGMFSNYLKTALRNLRRRKGYTFIHVTGLALGMACCLLLFQYVAYEYSFDRFNTRKDHIYRAALTGSKDGTETGTNATTGFIYGPTMAQEVPGILRYARVHPNYGDAVLSYPSPAGDRTFKEEGVVYVDSTFLSMFDYPLARGERALRPGTLLLSEEMARKYFGDEDPLGRSLDVTGWVEGPYTVTGVLEDVPPTSHLQFDFLLPVEDLLGQDQYTQEGADWGWQNFVTYLEIAPDADVSAVEAKITDVFLRHRGEQLSAAGVAVETFLQPLTDIHLNADVDGPAAVVSDRRTVRFFVLIGFITLVIALVNYVNLATARAMERAKEVGVRKVVGARRRQLVVQFLMESALMNLTALALAIGLSLALTPLVNRVAEIELTGALWRDGRFWAVFLGVFGLGALLAGLYPAFVLSSFKPATVLKGKAGGGSGMTLRKALVVVQFAASIALLVGTTIVYAQLDYMRRIDVGLDLEQILVVEGPRVRPEGVDRRASMNTMKDELRKIPGVREVALSSTTPGRGFNWYTQMRRATADPSTQVPARATSVDHAFADVYGLELVAGQPFREGMTAPEEGEPRVLVNEAMVRAVGFTSNEAAIDERISAGPGSGFVVHGVLKDFHWSSAHQEAEAVMFFYQDAGGHLSIETSTQDLPATIAAVRNAYETVFPGNPFEYYFADAAFDEQYRNDRRFAALFTTFAGIAILIACLGLFGLAAFTAEQRTKEIGVRKVLGASVASVVGLLSMDFLKLVGLAFVIAAPAAYYVMSRWLDDFAYHVEPGPGLFLLAGLLALAIALVTVSYQSIRAALADPVESLRYE